MGPSEFRRVRVEVLQLSLRRMGIVLGVAAETVCRYEHDRGKPPRDNVFVLYCLLAKLPPATLNNRRFDELNRAGRYYVLHQLLEAAYRGTPVPQKVQEAAAC